MGGTFTETLEPCLDCFVGGAAMEQNPWNFGQFGGDSRWGGSTLGDACYAVLSVVEIRQLGNDEVSRVRRHGSNNIKQLIPIQRRFVEWR